MTPKPSIWPAYSAAFVLAAVAFLAVGISMGIHMSVSHDHTLRPVHAHVNLLGWVTSAIMGLFYAHVGARLPSRLIWTQFALHVFGVVVGMAGLTALLTNFKPFLPALPVGTLALVVSAALFGWMVIQAARPPRA